MHQTHSERLSYHASVRLNLALSVAIYGLVYLTILGAVALAHSTISHF